MARKLRAEVKGYPTQKSEYTPLGGKSRNYRINATGEIVSKRQFQNSTRGYISTEQYTNLPDEVKERPGRGGRNTPSKHSRVSKNGMLRMTDFKWSIQYKKEKWDRFETQLMKILSGLDPAQIVRLYFRIKGDGNLSKSGQTFKKGRLAWFYSDNFQVIDFLENMKIFKGYANKTGPSPFVQSIEAVTNPAAGFIDYPIVKSAIFEYKEAI